MDFTMLEEKRFTWIPFYEEFSQKLMEYKDQVDENGNHSILVEKIKSLNSEWTDFLRAKAVNGDFADIDPFTIFAIFNRSSGMERRCAILKALRELFGVAAEIPQDFDGIPLANAYKSCFYFENEKRDTIPLLWKLFDAFMRGNTNVLIQFFNEAQKKAGIKWNLTMAFFWMKPNEYVPMDTKSRTYLKKLGIDIFSARKLTGERYLQLIDDVKNKIDESIPSISRHAFEMNNKLEVNGLMVQDNNEPWQDELIDAMDGNAKPGVFWWHELPVGQKSTIKLLREKLDDDGTFDFYIFQERKAVYKAVVADFVCSEEEYAAKKMEWLEYDTQWLNESFSDFQDKNGKRSAKILFYIEEFEKLEEPIPMDRFETSKEYKKPHIANLVPFKSIIEKGEKPMEAQDANKELSDLLKIKKNIILQGAPGSGKTYKTPELALSIIGELPTRNAGEDEKSFHKRVMEAYNAKIIKLNKDGSFINPDAQIGFVTFHQSMDYEDFVEGIKPEIVENDNGEDFVNYKICDGIFKAIVQHAKNATSSLENAINKFKKNMNGQKISTVKGHDLTVKIEEDNISIINSNNREYSISDNSLYKEEDYLRKNRWYYELAVKKALGVTQKDTNNKNYVLIIDEINRGNVSKIFGELISLLEADKRVGGDHPLTVTLPYSKESFSVPPNLYIIGTMNTTDRSVGSIDYAVRRRFAFVTLEANDKLVINKDAHDLFMAVKNFLNKSKYDMDIEDLMVGHSYFMTSDKDALKMRWQYEILPLLMEYHKDGIISKSPLKDASDKELADVKKNYAKFVEAWQKKESDTPNP